MSDSSRSRVRGYVGSLGRWRHGIEGEESEEGDVEEKFNSFDSNEQFENLAVTFVGVPTNSGSNE